MPNVLPGQPWHTGLVGAVLTGAVIGGIAGGLGYVVGKVFGAFANRSNRVVMSGHGGYEVGNGITTVPEGTSVTVYSKFGGSISDGLGNAIELNDSILSNVYSRTYTAGQQIPNYTLGPPAGLNITGNPITVTKPTLLSDLLGQYKGDIHWAACTACTGAKWSDQLWDIIGPVFANLPN